MKKIYFGAGLFNKAQLNYNESVVAQIRHYFDDDVHVYLPQENEAINDKSGYANSTMIAKADTDELLSSDIMIAVLDGDVIDAGVASEVGVAFANGIPILGLYTDMRQGTFGNKDKINALDIVAENQFHYANLYTVGLIKSNGDVYQSEDKLIQAILDIELGEY